MATVLYFDSSKDEGGEFPGVPKRDLEQAEFDVLPEWLQKSVKASPMYVTRNPNPTPRKQIEDKEGDT